jgi:hypothetical protein
MSSPLDKLVNYVNELIRSFDELISTIRGNMRLSAGWSAAMFLAGVTATFVLYRFQSLQKVPDLVKFGPTLLTSSITAFQIKPILVSRERIVGFRSIKGRLQNCAALPEARIEKLIAEAEETLDELRKRE